MCIAIIKPKNVGMPSREIIKQCVTRNKDGNGVVWLENGVLNIKKGLMTYQELDNFLTELESRINLTDTLVGLHMRITTHGGSSRENTHPFPISDKMSDLKELEFSVTGDNKVVIHNGIISGYSSYNSTNSDTQEFIVEFLNHIDNGDKNWYKNPHTVKAVENVLGSRLGVFTTDGEFATLGSGWVEDGGVWYSNTTYKVYTYTKSTSYYGGYNKNAYAYSYYDDYEDDDYYGSSYSSNKTGCGCDTKATSKNSKELMYIDTDDFNIYRVADLLTGSTKQFEIDRELSICAIDKDNSLYMYCHDTYMFIKRTDLQVTDTDGKEFIFEEEMAISEKVDVL